MTGPGDIAGRDKSVGRARVRIVGRRRRATRPARGAAPRPDVSTRVFQQPDPTAPIFVDGSGRRGRRLRRTVYWLLALTAALLLLWWLSQVFLAGWGLR